MNSEIENHLVFKTIRESPIPPDAVRYRFPPELGWFGVIDGIDYIWPVHPRFKEWCNLTIKGEHGAYKYSVRTDGRYEEHIWVWFADPQDAVMFKVAWL